MGIRSYIRDRKQVKASRATESGMSNPELEIMLSNWGKPSAEHVKKMDELYETHKSNTRAKRDSETAKAEAEKAEAEKESLARQQRPRPKPDHSGDERMRYLGDD